MLIIILLIVITFTYKNYHEGNDFDSIMIIGSIFALVEIAFECATLIYIFHH